jgi:hypothetical protein
MRCSICWFMRSKSFYIADRTGFFTNSKASFRLFVRQGNRGWRYSRSSGGRSDWLYKEQPIATGL